MQPYRVLISYRFRNLSVKNGDKPKNGHRAGTLSSMPQAPRRRISAEGDGQKDPHGCLRKKADRIR